MSRLQELRTLIANNQIRGGSAFGRSVAEVIALTVEAGNLPTVAAVRDAVVEASDWGVATKPSMTSVRAAAGLAKATLASSPGSSAVELSRAVSRAMRGFIAQSEVAIKSLADAGLPVFKSGDVVATHSFSESLIYVLRRAATAVSDVTILLTESRPLRESRHLAAALADTPATLEMYSDAGMAIAAQRATVAVVGADAILQDGSFANKTGSLPLALVCRHFGVPYYVAAELSKVHLGPVGEVAMEVRPPAELLDGWEFSASERVAVRNQFFEVVPADFVAGYITDRGLLTPTKAVAEARRSAEAA